MLVYILLSIYLVILFLAVRSTPTVDKDELIIKNAAPIRLKEYALVLLKIIAFETLIYLTDYWLKK